LTGKIKLDGSARDAEPMKGHTSFRIGGPADLYVAPRSPEEVARIAAWCSEQSVPCFFLGGGTNILVADRGIRGAVVDLGGLSGIEARDVPGGAVVSALSGTPVSEVAEFARDHGLRGMEFAYSLPGSIGGAVWMNARCYDREMSDILEYVEYLDERGVVRRDALDRAEWSYKRSPFQAGGKIILGAGVRLEPGSRSDIDALMRDHRSDRERKGHFLFPCAGSVFKNNRDFGAPTGKLIDSLGLKGRRIGGAQIAPFHGNIIINTGEATAADVLSLMRLMEAEVRARLGFALEREVVLVGDW
jgi:UDP-N-acetylmuramate dehydrogenase